MRKLATVYQSATLTWL